VNSVVFRKSGCFVFLLLFLINSSARAHMTGVSYGDIEIRGRQIDVLLRLNLRELRFARELDANADFVLTREEVERGIPRYLPRFLEHVRMQTAEEEGRGALRQVEFWPENGEVSLRLQYSFRQPLNEVSMTISLHGLTDSGHWNLAQVRYDGLQEQRHFNLENFQTQVVLLRSGLSHVKLGWRFIKVAIHRLTTHPDLLLFIAGLVLVGRSRRSFLAPPGSLLAAQLSTVLVGVWAGPVLPPRFVSSALALSVVYVAAENLLIREISHRSWIAGFFGLIYGLGFSTLIQDAGIPKRGLVSALIGFQTGIIVSVAVMVLFVRLMTDCSDRLRRQHQAVALGSLCLMAFGIFEFVQRTF
jgi:HupE / UreJ protein